jgi:FkbM family methyltransferase
MRNGANSVSNPTAKTGILSAASAAIDSLGLRKSSAGRHLIACLNVAGRTAARFVYLRRTTPFLVDGHRIFLSGNNAPSLLFVNSVLHGDYEPETKSLLTNLIRPGMIVFDVGAHVGHYTLLAARLVGPTGHVYAFEPEPDNYSLLTRNVALNGYANVTCTPKAVSNCSGSLTLYVNPQGNDRHSIVNDARSPVRLVERDVPTITLDEFVSTMGIPGVDVIKMDIEGAEPLALAGMAELLRSKAGLKLVMELAPQILRAGGTDPVEFLLSLRAMGFTLTPVEADVPPFGVEAQSLAALMADIEKRGAINVLCELNAEQSQTRKTN